jgi:RNA polymerase sigma-70 factor, ECF subfamily
VNSGPFKPFGNQRRPRGVRVSRAEIAPQREVKDLVHRAQRGDTAAFEELYRVHLGRVYALCLRLTSQAERAEELVQDVFVRVWERLGSFRGESAFGTWLYRLATNVVLDHLRGEGRRASWLLLTDDPAPLVVAEQAPEPGWSLDLEKAVAALPSGARVVFILHDIEGYRHGEIARLTGLAEGTSKAQLHRARRLLREGLQ